MRVGTFRAGGPVPGPGARGRRCTARSASPRSPRKAGLDAVWLAEHHFVPYGICPSAIDAGRPTARPYPADQGRHGGQRAAHRPPGGPRRAGRAAAPHLRRAVLAGRGARRAVGGPGGLRHAVSRRTRRGFPKHSICCCAGCASPAVGGRRRALRLPRGPRRAPAVGVPDGRRGAPRWSSPAPRRRACGWRPSTGCRCCSACTAATRRRPTMVALWRASTRRAAGRSAEEIAGAAHVSAGVVQIADRRSGRRGGADQGDARLAAAGPGRPCDGGRPAPRDARPAGVHRAALRTAPGGHPALCADRLAATRERTGHHPLRPARRGLGRPGGDRGERTSGWAPKCCRSSAEPPLSRMGGLYRREAPPRSRLHLPRRSGSSGIASAVPEFRATGSAADRAPR